ncbi:MAG: TonB-dependent receptor [Bacteroidota bacterium]
MFLLRFLTSQRIARLILRRIIPGAAILFFLVPGTLLADTKGKLSGRLLDKRGEPLIGANILIVGSTMGAATDVEGYYVVINIPPGTYDVRLSSIGYQTKIVQRLRISAGQTTTLNETLPEEVIEFQEEVVITADRPLVDTRQTSSVSILAKEDIAVLPVQDLNDIINLQAGVVDGHFRGGRKGEVQYQLDGVSVNNPFDNSSSVRLDRSVLQEVQVISGTFDAEYGQAMSGVVNAILRSGSEDAFEWSGETFVGDVHTFSNNRGFTFTRPLRPWAIQNYQLSLSGPTFLPATTFLVGFRRFTSEGYLFGERRFSPTDKSNLEAKIFFPTGDGSLVSMAPFSEWGGQLKLSNRSLQNIQFGYQAIGNSISEKRYSHFYRLNPDGAKTQRSVSLAHGFDWTHTLSNIMFYTVNVRQNYFEYSDLMYDDVFDPRYLEAGDPKSDPTYELGAAVQGVDLNRFRQKTNSFVVKASATYQATRSHLMKVGGEAQSSSLSFGSPGVLVPTTVEGVQVLLPRIDHPDYPGMKTHTPVSFAAFAQDRIEWNDIMVRAGLRMEYFSANASVPSDLHNPANSISGAPPSVPKKTTKKIVLAPRLGVSYPILERGSIFFSYGHFYQMPGLGQLFSNSDYFVLKELQAGGVSYGVLGNPDLKPEFTAQYEFGFKAELTEYFGMDVSLYSKDIRDLLGVEFVSTYAAAEYARLTNVDFGNVSGFTIALDHRSFGMLNVSVDYTYQFAQGNSSDPRETATRAEAGEDPRPRQVPLLWDQRHTLNAVLVLQKPDDFSVTSIIKFAGGQPYTPSIGTGFGASLEANSGRKPSSILVDLRGEKHIALAGLDLSVFARVFNLFDSRFFNGFVFGDTGSPEYSLNPVGDQVTLSDPSRYYAPRRIELGVSFRGVVQQ